MPSKSAGKLGRPAGKAGAKSGAQRARRQKLAAAVIAGKPVAQAAREQGISRTWASRETNSRETKLLIASILDAHEGKVRLLVGKALVAIEEAFQARDGKKRDHRVRLIAAKRVIEMAMAGRKVEEKSTEARTITYEQLEELYQGSKA